MLCIANAITEPKEHEGIEITEEMLEAGVAAYYQADRRFDSDDEVVTRLYRRMVLAQRGVTDPMSGPAP
jgi:hypothetical protein